MKIINTKQLREEMPERKVKAIPPRRVSAEVAEMRRVIAEIKAVSATIIAGDGDTKNALLALVGTAQKSLYAIESVAESLDKKATWTFSVERDSRDRLKTIRASKG